MLFIIFLSLYEYVLTNNIYHATVTSQFVKFVILYIKDNVKIYIYIYIYIICIMFTKDLYDQKKKLIIYSDLIELNFYI